MAVAEIGHRRHHIMAQSDTLLFRYWLVFVLLIVVGRVLLHCFIFPELRRRGIPYKIGGMGDHRAVSEFKRICIAERRPLTLWYDDRTLGSSICWCNCVVLPYPFPNMTSNHALSEPGYRTAAAINQPRGRRR